MTTTVLLTEEDAKLFIEFQRLYIAIKLLEKTGAFDVRSGTLTINFKADGAIGSFEIRKHFVVVD